MQCFEEACKLHPESVDYLSMAAKCWSDLTFYYDVRSDRERQLVNLKACEYAGKVRAALSPGTYSSTLLSVLKRGCEALRLRLLCQRVARLAVLNGTVPGMRNTNCLQQP